MSDMHSIIFLIFVYFVYNLPYSIAVFFFNNKSNNDDGLL